MFDIQYKGRFGERDETIQELRSIVNGITDKLLPDLDVMYEWMRKRDIYQNKMYGDPISDLTRKGFKNREEQRLAAENMFYPLNIFRNRKEYSEEEYKDAKRKRKNFVTLSNETSILFIQFDNAFEEIVSRFYELNTNADAGNMMYKESLEELGTDQKFLNNAVMKTRQMRNHFCHSYGFHNIFGKMIIAKLVGIRISVLHMKFFINHMIDAFELLEKERKLNNQFVRPLEKPKFNNKKKTQWYYFPNGI